MPPNLDGFVGRVDVNSTVALAAMVLQGASGGQTTVFSSAPVTSKIGLRMNTAYEEESNDTFETSQLLSLECEVLGTAISSNGGPDTDYYRFTASASDKLLITLQTDSVGSSVAPTITLYDSARQQVAAGAALAAGEDDQIISYAATAGTHYLKIQSDVGLARLNYRLTIIR